MTSFRLLFFTAVCCAMFTSVPAHAQLRQGSWRYGLDADIFAVSVVHKDPRGPIPDQKSTVVSLGPNQLGDSRTVVPTPQVGAAFAYALRQKWMLGLRTGLGYDRVAPENGPNQKSFALSLMPELTFLPVDLHSKAKLFLRFSPIIQYNHVKVGSTKQHIFMGCFSVGLGTFIFTSPHGSIDFGLYFEGRFGKFKPGPAGSDYVDVDDFRTVLRFGVSLWQ